MAQTIGGERCTVNNIDVNDSRAIVITQPGDPAMPPLPAVIHADEGAASWPPVASIPSFGALGTLSGNRGYIGGGYLYRNAGGNNWVSAGRHREPESELFIIGQGANEALLRGSYLFLGGREVDYWLPGDDFEVIEEWKTVRVYRPNAGNGYDYYARLNPDFDIGQWAPSEDGRRVAAIGPPGPRRIQPDQALRVRDSGQRHHSLRTAGQFRVGQPCALDAFRRAVRGYAVRGHPGLEPEQHDG